MRLPWKRQRPPFTVYIHTRYDNPQLRESIRQAVELIELREGITVPIRERSRQSSVVELESHAAGLMQRNIKAITAIFNAAADAQKETPA